MSIMIAAKRVLLAFLIVAGLALYALGASHNEPCPLPAEATASVTSANSAQSPEKEKCLEKVKHNGMDLCLPCPAAAAHIKHGDADEGPCSKPGNELRPVGHRSGV